jgi:hypothetical protein
MCQSPFRLHSTALNYAGLQPSFPPFTLALHSATLHSSIRGSSPLTSPPFTPPPFTPVIHSTALQSRPSMRRLSPFLQPQPFTLHSPSLRSRPLLRRLSLPPFTVPPCSLHSWDIRRWDLPGLAACNYVRRRYLKIRISTRGSHHRTLFTARLVD